MPLDPQQRYNSNCFAIEPNHDLVILEQETAIAQPHKNYKVYNIGRTPVYAEIISRTRQGFLHIVVRCRVDPSQTKVVDNKGHLFHITRLKIYNQTNDRAIVHASTEDEIFTRIVEREQGLFDAEYNKKLKDLFSVGVRFTPYLTKKFKGLLEVYWPSGKPNVWEQLEKKLEPFLETHTLYSVRGFLDSYITTIKTQLESVVTKLDGGEKPTNQYMQIATNLDEFEKRLAYGGNSYYDRSIRKFLLPLYSHFVLMKTTFLTLGIAFAKDIGLNTSRVDVIRGLLKKTIKGDTGATKYVSNMYTDMVNMVYDTYHPEDIYNVMMNTRSLIALHGIEYSRIWDNMLRNPSTTGEKIYNDVISYSTFFGRHTANLNKEALAVQMGPPLTPLFVGFGRNYIRSIEVYIWRKTPSAPARIGGMKIVFENDNVHIMGTVSQEVKSIAFNKKWVTKLTVTGDGAVDSCHFYMSDGRTLFFGTKEDDTLEETFELKDHHIVSFILSSDDVTLGGQAANIAVAYRLNDYCV